MMIIYASEFGTMERNSKRNTLENKLDAQDPSSKDPVSLISLNVNNVLFPINWRCSNFVIGADSQ